MKHASVLTLLLWVMPVWGADPPQLTIPAEVKAQPGQWVVVSPQTDCKSVTYVGLDGLSAFPSSELKDPRRLVVNASAAGRYRFVAVGTLNDEAAVVSFVIVVGDVPPGPGPGPAPTPSDPFTAALQTAYAADAGTDKAKALEFLQSAYKGMAANIKAGLITNAQALAWMHSVVATPALGLTDAQLVGVRKVIAAEMGAALGTNMAASLDAAVFKAELTKTASALSQVH